LAKKKSHEEDVRHGLAVLREAGLALDAPGPDLVPSLKAHQGKGRETDLAVIFLLGKIAVPPRSTRWPRSSGKAPIKISKKKSNARSSS
jgi:hypothetical protein